jgi:hypothetical protein
LGSSRSRCSEAGRLASDVNDRPVSRIGCGEDEVDDGLVEACGHRFRDNEGALEYGADDDIEGKDDVGAGGEITAVDAAFDGFYG